MSRYWIIYKLTLRREDTWQSHFSVVKKKKTLSKTPAPNPRERVHYTLYSTFTPYWGSVPGRSQAPYKPLALALAVFFQIIPQAKGRVDIPPSQSKLRRGRGEKKEGAMQTFKNGRIKQLDASLSTLYDGIAQSQHRTTAGLWPDQTPDDHWRFVISCYLSFPRLRALVDPVVIGQWLFFRVVQRKPL